MKITGRFEHIYQSFIGGGNRSTRRKPSPVASHWQTLSHNVVHLTLFEIRIHNIRWLQCKTHPWSFVTQALIVISPYNINNVHKPYTIAEIWVFPISRLKYLQFIKNIINFFVLSVPLWCRRGHDRMTTDVFYIVRWYYNQGLCDKWPRMCFTLYGDITIKACVTNDHGCVLHCTVILQSRPVWQMTTDVIRGHLSHRPWL
jgi:hypothetical protein